MKKFIQGMEKNYIAAFFAVVGLLLILFPEQLTPFTPYVLGIGLLLRGLVHIILVLYYRDKQFKPGQVILYWIFGAAILCCNSESIGYVGSIWAAYTLLTVAEEINKAWDEKKISALQVITTIITIVLSTLLLVFPYQYFSNYVRRLGVNMVVAVFARARQEKKGARE